MRNRRYDEKFGILQAPSLFVPDLRYFRSRCRLKRLPLVVGYMDIDEFKKFNTKYGNPLVDRYVLRPFMQTLAAHLVSRGFAYRYGGDEYVVILPNSTRGSAVRLMAGFQAKLEDIDYGITTANPTVSVGLYLIDRYCRLTEDEIEERASAAKDLAKNEGKNRIATCDGGTFEIVRRPSSMRRDRDGDLGF